MSITADNDLILSLEFDYEEVTPDAQVVAEQIAAHPGFPMKAMDLARGITEINYDLTQKQAWSFEITIVDPQWNLLDSNFFNVDQNGKLDDIDLNYPPGSRWWWRLHQFSPQQDTTIQLTFVPRIVAELMDHYGPVQANRAQMTRAQFLKMLCSKVKDKQGPIEFYSKELDIKQPIGTVTNPKSKKASGDAVAKKAAKAKGVGANASGLTVKGSKMDDTQAHFATLVMQTCEKEGASGPVHEAAMFAAIMESDLGKDCSWNPTYGGLLAGNVGTFGSMGSATSDAVAIAEIKAFIHGGQGYNGANGLQSQYSDIGQLAAHVEGCVVQGGGYGAGGYGQYGQEAGTTPAQVIQEAKAIVQAGGGAGGSLVSSNTAMVAQPYYFQIQAGEDYWTGMTRLAQEVAWELICDGNRIYYDADTCLITQMVVGVIDRDDPTTLQWNYDWVNRQVATNFVINILSNPLEFRAGEVLLVKNFGPASLGSTAKLPGRWLIDQIRRKKGDLYSEFTMVQPTAPKPEPVPSYVAATTAAGVATTPSTPGTAAAAYAAAQQLKAMQLHYTQANRTMTESGYPVGSSNLDCSASVSWVLLKAGFKLPAGITWGGWAPVSGEFTTGQAGLVAGPGQEMTIYASPSHVFIRIHPAGQSDMQGNTVSPLVGMRGFDFFPWNTSGCGNDGGPNPGNYWTVHYPNT